LRNEKSKEDREAYNQKLPYSDVMRVIKSSEMLLKGYVAEMENLIRKFWREETTWKTC
jgi:hypothetical protein